jgi:Mlc titration factor MtfA (ptsG expression regulator)
VIDFIARKTFSGKEGFRITREVQVSIAASAVQLSLGLDTWDLSYFKHIFVYPSDYKSPSTGKFHKGETNMGGFICFSWKAFEEGNAIAHDKINLGLHEFSHALRFNGVKGDETDYFFRHYFARWLACSSSEFNKLKDNIPGSIFRKYGGVNIEEFFSVTVETFFETPLEFKAALPELYLQTSVLLNQTFSEDGSVIMDCREALMKDSGFKLTKDYSNAMRFSMRNNGLVILAVVFLLAGIFAIIKEGYLSPVPYVLLAVAAAMWVYLERQYTSVFFEKEQLRVRKGFLIFKNSRTIVIPYSQLISFKANNESAGNYRWFKQAGSASVSYYHKGDFYRDALHMSSVQPVFDELCNELKRNGIFVVNNG